MDYMTKEEIIEIVCQMIIKHDQFVLEPFFQEKFLSQKHDEKNNVSTKSCVKNN